MMRAIVDIFVPEHIGQNYILSTTVLGISIEETKIIGTVLTLNNTKITIEKVIEEPIQETKGGQLSKVASTLASLVKKVGSYNKIVTSIPSSFVLFKQLTLPFNDPDKIRMVLPYEIESLLPFPIHETTLDFIITSQETEKASTSVMVAAVQKALIHEHLKPFEEAGLSVEDISVDAIGLYSIYIRQHPTRQKGNTALVDLGKDSTKIIFFNHGTLKHIRTLKEGLLSSKKSSLWDKINFTLQAFADEEGIESTIKAVTIMGLKDKAAFEEAKANIAFTCELFSLKNFLEISKINYLPKTSHLDVINLASTLPLPDGRFFKLQPNFATKQDQARLNRQTLTALFLSAATIILLAGHTIKEFNKLSTELEKSQKEVLQTLKKHFPSIKTNNRRDAVELAQREVIKEQNIWSSFSSQTRESFLKYLYDLSTKIDRETLGLNLKKMTLTKKYISLEGSVRSFDAVEQFEQQLKETNLFSNVPDMQKVDFAVQLQLDSKGIL